jgi:glycosyltransferase involved in cell wall biosynthesis
MRSPRSLRPGSVSVVIPCWRCADVVGRAVASVAAQTLPALEVILIDDASGDATLETLHGLASRYGSGWIKVIGLSSNAGPGAARNAGWDAAAGDCVAFLDADDAWHSRKLELQTAWMAEHPDIDFTGHSSKVMRQGEREPAISTVPNARSVTIGNILFANPIPTRSVVVKRAIRQRFAGRLVAEDLLLWLQLVATGSSCRVLDAPLAFTYRPEFSPGGYSGELWRHEMRELRAIKVARQQRMLPLTGWLLAAGWSLLKYVRRVCVAASRRLAT